MQSADAARTGRHGGTREKPSQARPRQLTRVKAWQRGEKRSFRDQAIDIGQLPRHTRIFLVNPSHQPSYGFSTLVIQRIEPRLLLRAPLDTGHEAQEREQPLPGKSWNLSSCASICQSEYVTGLVTSRERGTARTGRCHLMKELVGFR